MAFGAALLVTCLYCVSCKPKAASPTPPATNSAPAIGPLPAATNNKPAASIAPPTFTAKEAKDHVGEFATVVGKVFGVYVSQKGDVFINIGGAHPNQPFTAVCFQGAIPTEELKKYEGKTVKVTGKIKDYNGQIEIILDRPEQISE